MWRRRCRSAGWRSRRGLFISTRRIPSIPVLDLQGTSLIRDYTVRVYVYGTADAPEAVFTSEPPLPQEEIISLLATGTTREELASGGNVLAGRALMLLGQQLYQKVFKKGQATQYQLDFR